MNRLFRRTPSPAMVVACLALAVALGGSGYAAIKIPRNSVGTAQLKKNAVVASKVKNHSLKAIDFAYGQLPRGPKGDPGGIAGVVVRSASVSVPGGAKPGSASVTRKCRLDEQAMSAGTGWDTSLVDPLLYTSYVQPMKDVNGFVTGYRAAGINGTQTARKFTLYVLCYPF